MGKLANLLRWHRIIILKDLNGIPLRDEETNDPITVAVRIIGDKDLEEASLIARLESAKHRLLLMNEDSQVFKDEVQIFSEADKTACMQMIMAGEGANWTQEALSNVVRPDDPTLEEVAVDPDAPTLKELEEFDSKLKELKEEYNKELEKYIKDRQEVLFAEIELKSLAELQEQAKISVAIVRSIEIYLNTLRDEKVWRSVYSDKEMTIREFNTFEDFQNLDVHIKNQLRNTYAELEEGRENVKN